MIDVILKLNGYTKLIKCIHPMVGNVILDKNLTLVVSKVVLIGNSNTVECHVVSGNKLSDQILKDKGWSK